MHLPVPTCVFLLYFINSALSARILAILPLPGKSHFISNQAVLSALSARGHHVTVYSPFTPPQPIPNMKHIEIHTDFETDMRKIWTFDVFKQFVNQGSYLKLGARPIWQMSYRMSEELFNLEKIKALIASKENFDLVITEALFGQESMAVFGHFFSAPVINLNGFGTWSIINRIHGNALQIASAPDCVSYPFTDQMSFSERLRNLVSTAVTFLIYRYEHLPRHEDIIKRTFNDPSIPPLEEMVNNISLTIANFHPLVSYPRSYTGNIIPVGGIHIPQQPAPLPQDVKEFLDSGKKSVIYFSLGTVVPVHLMPPEYIQLFINVFKKLPYKILWKIETDSIPNLPANVKIAKWLPQQSVLAHPNCVLFITHGGLLSQLEVFHAGVPVVGIPFFGDQPFNVKVYEHFGIGVKLDFDTINEESFYKAILSVVGKPKYIENAKKASQLFRHVPLSANDTAVFWTEYVLRHSGARHLTPHASRMSWYQLALMDVAAVVLGAIFVVFYIVKKTLRLLWNLCCNNKTVTISKKETSKKKNN